QVRPGPPIGVESGLERGPTHEYRVTALLELDEAIALGIKCRISELGRPTVRRGHVAVETDAHSGSDLHLPAPFETLALPGRQEFADDPPGATTGGWVVTSAEAPDQHETVRTPSGSVPPGGLGPDLRRLVRLRQRLLLRLKRPR